MQVVYNWILATFHDMANPWKSNLSRVLYYANLVRSLSICYKFEVAMDLAATYA